MKLPFTDNFVFSLSDWFEPADTPPGASATNSSAGNIVTLIPGSPTMALYLTEAGNSAPVSVTDIHQGQLADCFLLASIGDIAEQSPSFIPAMIKQNSNGTETVTLHEASDGTLPTYTTTSFKTVTETVTNVFPSSSVNSAGQDTVNGVQEIWPQVLEKAIAQLDGGYSAIASGGSPLVAMEELTGKATSFMAPKNLTLAMLDSFVAQGDLLVMDTFKTGVLPDNLVNNHSYIFGGVTGTGAGASVQLLNPWGTNQPASIPLSQLSKGITEVDIGKV